jgi:hypothetical protein
MKKKIDSEISGIFNPSEKIIEEAVQYYNEIFSYNKALKLSKIFKGIEGITHHEVFEKMERLGKELTTVRIKYGKETQKLTEIKLCEILVHLGKENQSFNDKIKRSVEQFIRIKDFERSSHKEAYHG